MSAPRTFAGCCLILCLIGATTAEAAPRRGAANWWWARQAAFPYRATEIAPAAIDAYAAAPVDPYSAPPVVASVAAPSPQAVSTASLFGYPAAAAPTGLIGAPAVAAPVAPPAAMAPVAPAYSYDAYINLGAGNYAGSENLTTGGARPWYESPVVQGFYGGQPDTQQQADFGATVLQRVEQTFRDSGVPVALTIDPGQMASAAHQLSIVSGTAYAQDPNAIGITDMGRDGFSFLDKLTYANSLDQLEWAVARNVAHELMHAFNVEHHDRTGGFLDAPVASWDMLVGSGTVFSGDAVADLLNQDFRSRPGGGTLGAQGLDGTLLIAPSPVPEPTTWALWGLAATVGIVLKRRGRRRA